MTAASPCPVCPAEETAIIVAPHISSRDAVSIIPFQDTLRPRGHVISHTPRIQYSIHARHGFSMRDARCFASSFRIPFGTEAARFIHGHLRTYHTKPSFVFPVSVRARPGNAIVCSGEIMKTFNIEPSNRIHMAFIVTVIRDGMQSSGVSACWSASSMLICFIESDGRFMTQESLFRHDGNTFPPGTRHSICILLSLIPRRHPHRGHPFFCWQCGQSHVHPRLVFQVREADRDHAEIYARFRPVGYDNGVSLSRFLCCRSYRKQFAQ